MYNFHRCQEYLTNAFDSTYYFNGCFSKSERGQALDCFEFAK